LFNFRPSIVDFSEAILLYFINLRSYVSPSVE
jgi:hypothetical protein